MRRFIYSLHGKAIAGVTVLALLLPFFTLATLRVSHAQVDQREPWAVVDFVDKSPTKVDGLGKAAAEAVGAELAKNDRLDILPAETVNRGISELGLQSPVSGREELMRLGQNLRAVTIVAGEIVNQRVVTNGATKTGEVKVRVIVTDVASGLPVNGAAVLGESKNNAADADNGQILRAAIADAAFRAAREVNQNTLPKATVLNTLDRTALINQGTRTGFDRGQEVIVLRGREQVATAQVTEVEPDSAFIRITRQTKGIQPGDKVQVVFKVPVVNAKFGKAGDVGAVRDRKASNQSGIITLLIVLGIVVFLLGSGRGSNNNTIQDVNARAVMDDADRPGVRINWRPDAFIKGSTDRFAWQIWRSDVPDAPVQIVPGAADPVAFDYGDGGTFNWYNFVGSAQDAAGCQGLPGGSSTTRIALQSGRPYVYSVELVFKVSQLASPGFSAGGGTTGGATTGGATTGGVTTGGATTGGVTTGGATTGGGIGFYSDTADLGEYYGQTGTTTGATTGGATGGGATQDCYFVTPRAVARGSATPFARPVLRAPDNNVTIASPPVFRFDSVRGGVNSVVIEYALQISTDVLFAPGATVTIVKQTDTAGLGTLSTRAVPEALTIFPGVTRLYWRIGAKNAADTPGPVDLRYPNAADYGYVWSAPFSFQRPTTPPGP